MNEDLLAVARKKRDELRKKASVARLVAEDAETEARSAEEAVEMLEAIEREQSEVAHA